MKSILEGLNKAQEAAVASDAQVLQVLAPPGSGKTKTLTARVAYFIAERQLQPWNIIVCTFTVKAASEMKQRIRGFVGEEMAKQLKLGTFHSVALRYLKLYGHNIGLDKDFGIADSSDSKAILKRIIKKLGLGFEPGQALGRISSMKAKGHSNPQGEKATKTAEQQEFRLLFEEYEATLAASNLLDYDDILLRCCFLLRSHPQCVSNVQAVLIDEFQDTNNIQYDLMRLFAQERDVITIVGDPDQSIYGFRSAEIKNLTRMKSHWPDTLTINLEYNYRSSGAILHAAQNIIEQDDSRPPKKLQATHSFGLRPVLRKLPSASVEAEWLVSEIKRMQVLSGNMIEHSDIAILLRSAALSRVIEAALVNAGMPYRMVGGLRFYDRAEVKLVVDYLRVIHQPDNSEAVQRIINVPSRRVGDKTIKALHNEAQSKERSLWSLILDVAQGHCSPTTKLTEPNLKGLSSFVNVIITGRKKVESWNVEQPSLVDLINLISQKISLQSYLRSKHSDDETYEARWTNVEELIAQARDVIATGKVEELAESDGLPVVEGLEQRNSSAQDMLSVFLTNIALTASAEKTSQEDGERAQQITLSTIHAAKGLEWPVVFIPACYDGSIPHSRADDHDEERRLLYVGMTRAQALLYLSCPIKSTLREETTMSVFLTHSGVGRFFEEHGPSLPSDAVRRLSTTLKRQCPSEETIVRLRRGLQSDEDNHWPVNGEEAVEQDYEFSKPVQPGFGSAETANGIYSNNTAMQQGFSTATAILPATGGFTSAAARYDELVEELKLRKIDKRAEKREQSANSSKGVKRRIEGQGHIASFFTKKAKAAAQPAAQPTATLPQHVQTVKQPLRDLPQIAANQSTRAISSARQTIPLHKPSCTPMFTRPAASRNGDGENSRQYVFLSSSPTKPDEAEATGYDAEQDDDDLPTQMRPASTFHTTSMARTAPQRKTLGVRRSLHGWSATHGRN